MRSKYSLYNMLSSIALQLVVIIYGFVVPKIIISNFGSDVNGLISSITQFLAYITLLESGVGPVVKAALYKPIAKKNQKEIANIIYRSNKFFKTIAKIFIGYLIILAVVYPLIINVQFDYFFTFSLIIIISLSTFAEYYFGMTYRLFLQSSQKTYIISFIQIITYILSCITIVILTKLNFSIHIIKLVASLIFILRPIIQNLYVKKKFRINISNCDKNYELKQKWDGLVHHIAYIIHSNTDITMLTFFCSLKEVSVYSVYYLIVNGIKSIVQVIVNSVSASFGDMIANGEKDNLRNKFSMFEFVYYSLVTVVYSCSIVLIISFVKVYTLGINDANYIRPLFGVLLVISELIWSIRLPYSTIVLSAGHFKETKRGSWIEAISNIAISIILVFKLGIIGVAIGTAVAMLIRTIEFVIHSNKYILKRNVFVSVKKIILIIIELFIIYLIGNKFDLMTVNNYFDWIKYAIIIFGMSCIIVIPTNIILFKRDFNEFIKIMKNILIRNNK